MLQFIKVTTWGGEKHPNKTSSQGDAKRTSTYYRWSWTQGHLPVFQAPKISCCGVTVGATEASFQMKYMIVILMATIRQTTWYGWWLTGWFRKYPIIDRVLYIPGGAGYLPSTVCLNPQSEKHVGLYTSQAAWCFHESKRWLLNNSGVQNDHSLQEWSSTLKRDHFKKERIIFQLPTINVQRRTCQFQGMCTVMKVDGATPKRWLSKGPW